MASGRVPKMIRTFCKMFSPEGQRWDDVVRWIRFSGKRFADDAVYSLPPYGMRSRTIIGNDPVGSHMGILASVRQGFHGRMSENGTRLAARVFAYLNNSTVLKSTPALRSPRIRRIVEAQLMSGSNTPWK